MSTSPDPARTTKLGKLGELAFSTWATQANLLVNSSEYDEAGWDFVVELPPSAATPSTSPLPVHAETFSFRGRVQVKSTDGTDRFVNVKLSNWLRMVDDPQPTYFAVIEFDGLDVPQSAFVVHVGEELIRRTLERAHKNAIESAQPLHKLTMRLSYGEEHRLEPLGGQPLLVRLLSGMAEGGETWAEYAAWKGRLNHTAGFEGGNVQVHLTIPKEPGVPLDPVALFADLETGIVPSISISKAELFRTRFGRVDPTPFETVGPSKIITGGGGAQCFGTVEVRAKGTTARCRSIATIHVPSGLPYAIKANADLSSFNLRIVAPHLEITTRFSGRSGTFQQTSPEVGQQVSAPNVRLYAQLARVLSIAAHRGTDLQIEIVNGQDTILEFELPASDPQTARLKEQEATAAVLGRYASLCELFGVLGEATVALDQIQRHQEALATFAAYAEDAYQIDDFTFSIAPLEGRPVPTDEYEGQRIITLSPWGITLGSHTFVVILAAWGTLERLREQDGTIDYRLVGDPILRIARLAHEGTIEAFPMWELITDAAHQAKAKEDTGKFVVFSVEPTGPGALGEPPKALPDTSETSA